MKSPLVTIVTPSFNQGRFIRETIESVLCQDYPRIEYIVMDGGSTDETADIAKEYASRLTWISEKDRGQSHAINKGFQKASGEIVSWLNSDDVISPGAVTKAVRAFERNPQLGAVYGDGHQIDINGNVKNRFATEPFNLWKLIYVSDYILQQASYFRREVFESIGYLDESLHFAMDWDIFIRIGKHYSIEYIPEYMGSIREYAEAKSFSGGRKRFQELATLMRRHCEMSYPPGYFIYGLDTYWKIWSNWIQECTPQFLSWPSGLIQRVLHGITCRVINHALRSQGLYSDGWAAPKLQYMLGPGSGRVQMRGRLPRIARHLEKQELSIDCNGVQVSNVRIPTGEFSFSFDAPSASADRASNFTIRASRSIVPAISGLSRDFRRLAYVFQSFQWV